MASSCSFLFHDLTSLHPPSFQRNDFSTCITVGGSTVHTEMFGFDFAEVSLGLFLFGVGQFVEHPKLESHHLHFLCVLWMVGEKIVHQGNAQLLLL